MATTRTKKPAREQVIYCGPNLPGGKLVAFTVFSGGIPAYVQEYIDACPAISGLVVPVADLGKVRARLGDKTSREASLFAQVRKHFKA